MSESIVRTEDLWVEYPISRGLFKSVKIYAVNGVTIDIKKGEIVGVIGESGSGKTTLGKAILKLVDITQGKIYWGDKDVSRWSNRKLRKLRRYYQMIQQDPYSSLDSRMKIYDIIAEGLRVNKLVHSKEEEREIIYNALKDVKLNPPEVFFDKLPTELSGGQRQRVVIARAIVMKPKFIVADEPISMLDASTRGQVLEIIRNIKNETGTSFMFITHDIALGSYISERLAVMYTGTLVEIAGSEDIIKKPLHPYTQALIEAVPKANPEAGIPKVNIKGEQEPLFEKPKGCVFYDRCPFAMNVCKEKIPSLKDMGNNHYVACHLY
ncbi:ABC transporter ATP-binding protein [Acidianus manzaensis]|uniref:Oligopeptide ABC transporter ATP-binding protein n=1 Tax=Acidianus manzaensis TaxID=282676 RepID=A0A1W6JYZ0_9CREN|nr:ABC transporter ATP-binding protein [Acidianus manzaensis]ARM75478.1 oligopeptide ABC transporter ATP-binding protein [Acidianus manzaensis]